MNDTIDMEAIPWFGYRRRTRGEAVAMRTAEALASAVKLRLPIVPALEDLHTELGRWRSRPAVRLERLIHDLSRGQPLGESLARHMGAWLPPYYAVAVQKAEAEKRLETVLPLLAERLQYQQAVADDRFPYMPLLIFQVSVILLIFLFQKTMIVPVFFQMAGDYGARLPLVTGRMLAQANSVLALCFLAGLALFFLLKNLAFREAVFPRMPFVGREKRRLLVRDLAQSMSVFLATGEDVLGAARWSLKATLSPWLKPRLQQFVDRVTGGENWAQAWERMDLGSFTYPWLIVNAAARQNPQGGFEMLSDWMHQDISHTTRMLRRWFTPCVVIVLGMVVLTLAGTFFGLMGAMSGFVFAR